MVETIIPIKSTRMGAVKKAIPVSPTIKVEEKWGHTHGEAKITGTGQFLLVDISNWGIHRCKIIQLNGDGSMQIIDQAAMTRFCPLCQKYL